MYTLAAGALLDTLLKFSWWIVAATCLRVFWPCVVRRSSTGLL
jgi:hypothetical protein